MGWRFGQKSRLFLRLVLRMECPDPRGVLQLSVMYRFPDRIGLVSQYGTHYGLDFRVTSLVVRRG